jgi:hypothetical protein
LSFEHGTTTSVLMVPPTAARGCHRCVGCDHRRLSQPTADRARALHPRHAPLGERSKISSALVCCDGAHDRMMRAHRPQPAAVPTVDAQLEPVLTGDRRLIAPPVDRVDLAASDEHDTEPLVAHTDLDLGSADILDVAQRHAPARQPAHRDTLADVQLVLDIRRVHDAVSFAVP